MKTFKINGQELNGEIVPFTMVQEPFSVYQLEDGTFLKVKTVLLKVIKTDQLNPVDGTPAYSIISQTVLATEEKE